MPLNFDAPVTTTAYTAVLSTLRDHVAAATKFLEGETLSGTTPTNAKRYNATSDLFEAWNGSAWAEMPLAYAKKAGDTFNGSVVIAMAPSSQALNVASTNMSMMFVPEANAGSWNALVQSQDNLLLYRGASQDTGALVIGQWTSGQRGLRLGENVQVGRNSRLDLLHTGAAGFGVAMIISQDQVGNSDGPKISFKKLQQDATTTKFTFGINNGVNTKRLVISSGGDETNFGAPIFGIGLDGDLNVAGANAALGFQDRGGSPAWLWYSSSSIARLYNGSSDVLQMTTGGVATFVGTVRTSVGWDGTNGGFQQARGNYLKWSSNLGANTTGDMLFGDGNSSFSAWRWTGSAWDAIFGILTGQAGGGVTVRSDVSGSNVELGFRDIVYRTAINSHTLALADRGCLLQMASSGQTVTIPTESSVAFPNGAAVTIANFSGGNTTLAQGSGCTLFWAGQNITGNRTLATGGLCTLVKLNSTTWVVSGAGLS